MATLLDSMTMCICGHPLWCHAKYRSNPDPEGTTPYVQDEPGECDHIGPGGWDCDCPTFVIAPTQGIDFPI